jgi:hypothetical protein
LVRWVAVVACAAACQGGGKSAPPHAEPPAAPRLAPVPDPMPPAEPPARAPVVTAPCAVHGSELVYVVDHAGELLSFDPRRLPEDPFQLVAKLTCDDGFGPFSMAVDHSGIAWVRYDDGQLFRVSILDGRCALAGLDGNDGEGFGMAFVHVGSGSDDEVLYTAARGDGEFGTIDTAQATPAWHRVGTTLHGSDANAPDLTGTRDGELFAYFPETGAPSFVQQLDTRTGAPKGRRWNLPTRGTEAQAWAFAHWAGVFYVFATFDDNTAVYAVHRKTGKAEVVRDHVPYKITGAGVSTCAPELEKAD